MSPAGTHWPWQHTHKLGTAPWAPRDIKIRCNVSVQKTNSTMHWRPKYQHPTQLLVHRVTPSQHIWWPYQPLWATDQNNTSQAESVSQIHSASFPWHVSENQVDNRINKDVERHDQCNLFPLSVVQCLFLCKINQAFSCDKIIDQFRISQATMQTSAGTYMP